MNKLIQLALIEPTMAIFVIKKLLPMVDELVIKEAVKELNDESIEELTGIFWSLGYSDEEINKILK